MVEVPSEAPFVSNRSLRTIESGIATKDPLVIHLAEEGEADPGYCALIGQITGSLKTIGNDSAYFDCKPLFPFLSVEDVGEGKKVIVHNGNEILVPIKGRKKLVETLHSTHMATDTMVRASKGKFLWPGIKSDLHERYKNCGECLMYSKEKIDKPDQVPESLTSLFPGEKLSVDFMEVLGKDIFLVVDHVSSHVYGKITTDKSFNSAKVALEEYFHLYSLPYSIQSDNGPAFRNQWLQWLSDIHVSCHFTSPYRSSSNGLVERSVAKVKNALLKLGKVTKEILGKVVFDLNCTEHQDGSNSPSVKFLSRGIRSYLPNSMSMEVDRRALVKKRQEAQEKIASRKGYSSRDTFSVGDRVRIKSHIDGRWSTSGVVVDTRPSGTSSQPASFLIKTSTGAELLRHKSYMKHDIKEQLQDIDPDIDTSLSASGKPVGVAPVLPGDTAADPDPTARPWEGRLRARKPRE